MSQQIILACNDEGQFLEYIPKEIGHKDRGRRHLAIAVLLFNSKGQVLLQKRKHKIFDNIWDLTGATHPLHKPHPCHSERLAKNLPRTGKIASSKTPRNDGKCKICNKDNIDESLEEATRRCLEVEWEIREIREIRDMGVFNYFARYGQYCENEHCHLMVGEYDGEVNMSPDTGYEYKWMGKQEFLEDIKSNPKKYTPWVIKGAKLLNEFLFWGGR